MTPLEQMIELWRGIARLHRSDSVVQAKLRDQIRQRYLGMLADSIANMVSCYSHTLNEAEACDSSRIVDR